MPLKRYPKTKRAAVAATDIPEGKDEEYREQDNAQRRLEEVPPRFEELAAALVHLYVGGMLAVYQPEHGPDAEHLHERDERLAPADSGCASQG
jgi:hypothetical protein